MYLTWKWLRREIWRWRTTIVLISFLVVCSNMMHNCIWREVHITLGHSLCPRVHTYGTSLTQKYKSVWKLQSHRTWKAPWPSFQAALHCCWHDLQAAIREKLQLYWKGFRILFFSLNEHIAMRRNIIYFSYVICNFFVWSDWQSLLYWF